jgi:ribonuclease Z
MKIHFLGTGSAYPGESRDNTSFCLSYEDTAVLIDVSGNPCRKLKKFGIGLGQLDVVVLTHFHIDHIYGLPSLLWGMWLEHRKKPLKILVDYRNEHKLKQWLHTMDIESWGIEFPVHLGTFNGDHSEQIFEEEVLKISCFPALHSVPTVGLEIIAGERLVVYSADTEVNRHIQSYEKLDMLIHEATFAKGNNPNHTSLEEIAETYHLATIGKVILVHLSEDEPYEEVLTKLEENHVKLAEDGLTIQL